MLYTKPLSKKINYYDDDLRTLSADIRILKSDALWSNKSNVTVVELK